MKKSLLIILAAILMAGCGGKKQGQVRISGAFALYPMTQRWSDEYTKANPDVQFMISAKGAGAGMTDVLNGMVDLAMFSRAVTKEEESKGAWKIAVAKDVVLPTINASNPAYAELKKRGLTQEEFKKIYITQEITDWSELGLENGGKINLYTRGDACGAAEMWAKYLGGKQEDLKGIGVNSDPGICEAVIQDVKGVGFNNINYAYDIKTGKTLKGIAIIPIDINGNGSIDADEDLYSDMKLVNKSIREGKFPEPPARELYFISKGKPTNEIVLDFLKYVLTDGQAFVEESGYVKLPEERIKEELKKL